MQIKRRPPPGQQGQQGPSTPNACNPSAESLLMQEFRAKTAPGSSFSDMAFMGSGAIRNQQRTIQNPRQPPARTVHVSGDTNKEIVALKQQIHSLNTTVQNWHQVLTEITQAVFVVNATCAVDQVPYYIEMPEGKEALRSPVDYVRAGQKVTLMYPQFQRPDMLYMRLRVCDEHSAEVQQYYVPVANQGLSTRDLVELTGINADVDQYFDWFHNPGEADPAPEGA
jgi:hypothetical protein